MTIYVQASAPHHPRTSSSGCVYGHILVAERALGHLLPAGAQVHHVDGNKRHNVNHNLVICQDTAYHKLLHYRAKIVKMGGNPNTQKFCADCQSLKALSAFNVMRSNKSTGRQSICRECAIIRDEAKRARRRRSEAA